VRRSTHLSAAAGGLLGFILLQAPASAATPELAPTSTPATARDLPATPTAASALPLPATPASSPSGLSGPSGQSSPAPETNGPIADVVVEAPEAQFVAPTNRDHIGRIWAPVLINGKGPFRLVVDTGASHSALTAAVVNKLGALPGSTQNVIVRGVTGSAVVPSIHVDTMEVGDLLVSSTLLPVVADVFGGAQGVLGREGLPDKRIFADFAHDRLVIARSHKERAPPGFTVIDLKMTRMGLLASDVRIGGIRAQAIIDTGAQMTVGNLALRNALMRRRPSNVHSEGIVGVSLDVQQGDDIPAPPMSLGSLKVEGVHVVFGDMFLFEHWNLTREPALLIGMDVLGLFDVLVIDYKLRQMQVRMRGTR
jgi:predicted aspartyl protease